MNQFPAYVPVSYLKAKVLVADYMIDMDQLMGLPLGLGFTYEPINLTPLEQQRLFPIPSAALPSSGTPFFSPSTSPLPLRSALVSPVGTPGRAGSILDTTNPFLKVPK